MNRITVGLAAIAALSIGAPRAAWADPFWNGQTLCATSNLSVCASVTVEQTANSGGSNTLRVTVMNTGSAGSIFTIGLFNTPAWSGTWSIVSATKVGVGDVTSLWKEGDQSLNNAIDWGVTKDGAAAGGINAGETVVFFIDFTPGFYIDDNTGLAWHAGALQISEKCITGDTGDAACTPPPPPSSVPEPISMILLGTGLAGVGGIGALRRRRGYHVETA